MAASNNPSNQKNYLKEIVEFAIKDDNFRIAFSQNSKDAINSKHTELGFSYNELSNESREVLDSLTSEEIGTLHTISQKSEIAGRGLRKCSRLDKRCFQLINYKI